MAESSRLDRLEIKLDTLQTQAHHNHLELLSCFRSANDELEEKIVNLEKTVERHGSYFSGLLKLIGLGGALSSWLAFRDFFSNK